MPLTAYYVIGAAVGILVFIIPLLIIKTRSQSLNRKFYKLGNLKGKTYDEIKAAVGPENSRSATTSADGAPVIIRQWMKPGYHIVLLFDQKDVCLGISSETKA